MAAVSVKALMPGDRVRMPYGSHGIRTVVQAFEARPGRGIKGAGWQVFWADDSGSIGSGTLYRKTDTVDRLEAGEV